MAALSFCTTARSSAIVFAERTLRINCLTAIDVCQRPGGGGLSSYKKCGETTYGKSWWWPLRPLTGEILDTGGNVLLCNRTAISKLVTTAIISYQCSRRKG